MQSVFLVLLLVAAVVGANAVYARFSQLPAALLQIMAGLILSLTPLYQHFELAPEVFLFAIISVLMFNDGQHTSMRKLSHQLGTTLSLAVGLAIVTILVIGGVTHLIMPAFSLALSLALGAIITPTDPVAVSSITSKIAMPKDVMATLENESLFNDASGIVAFNLAIAALVTGQFSAINGIGNFLYVFVGGILVGVLLGYIIVAIRIKLINLRVDTPSVIVPYTVLTPFVVYLLAESIGVSGILAVVATGLIHGLQQERLRLTTSQLQIVMTTTWSIIASILNGIVFVLLGVSLPSVIRHIQQRDTRSIAILIGVGAVLYVVMTLVRFLWIQFDFAHIRSWTKQEKVHNSLVAALSGVHGTITLAMAFSLPLTLGNHTFTYRNDVIFIAAVVILISLLVPTFILPRLLPAQTVKVAAADLAQAKTEMVMNASHQLSAQYGDNSNVGQVLLLLEGQQALDGRPNSAELNALFDDAYACEIQTINDEVANHKLAPELADRYLRMAEKTRFRNQQSFWQRCLFIFKFGILGRWSFSKQARRRRQFMHQLRRQNATREQALARNQQFWQQMREMEQKPYAAVIALLNQRYTPQNQQAIGVVRRAYDERHRRLSGTRDFQQAQNELLIEAFQLEYNFVQTQLATKKYSRDLGNQLYEQISTDQLVYLQSISAD